MRCRPFELDAVDYLTKPVRLQRLQQALAQGAACQRSGNIHATGRTGQWRDAIQERGRTERVPLAEVLFLRAEQKYVTVRTATRSFIVDDALSELERHAAHFFARAPQHLGGALRHMRALGAALRRGRGRGLGRAPQGLRTELVARPRRQVAAVREALAG